MSRAAVCLLVVLVSCSGEGGAREAAPAPQPSPGGTPTVRRAEASRDGSPLPEPKAHIPRSPGALAHELESVERHLYGAIERWLMDGPPPARVRRAVTLLALRQQRIYRTLVKRARLSRRVIDRLSHGAQRVAERVDVARRLRALAVPVKAPPRMNLAKPAPPHVLLSLYKKAEARYGVPWEVLAAVNFVESRFGRMLGPSTAGALGPMQFIPPTWELYGRGDVTDPRAAIPAAARLLAASGAPEDLRSALFAYNHADEYVDAVLLYAADIESDIRNFYAYYHWQAFMTTTTGDVQLTGPGADKGIGR